MNSQNLKMYQAYMSYVFWQKGIFSNRLQLSSCPSAHTAGFSTSVLAKGKS